jgi:hypothetical protein
MKTEGSNKNKTRNKQIENKLSSEKNNKAKVFGRRKKSLWGRKGLINL